MASFKLSLSLISAAALLAACGGSDPVNGSLIDTPSTLATLTKAQLDASGLIGLSGPAKCDVKLVSLNYVTPGAKGESSNASGVLLLPTGAGCTAAAPLVAYAKGTDVQKPRTLANPTDGETGLLAAMYAGQGYAVVATDYLGFAKSNYSYHPYLHADSEATSVIDSIRAARNAVSSQGGSLNGKVMLTGYSQGGHASMAAHREIEKNLSGEIKVVAGAHLAGPYNLSGSMKFPDAIAGYQFFVPYLVTAWQKIYGNLYNNVNEAFKAPYAAGIESLLPSPTLNYTTLVTSGKLPGINGETPNQARDALFQPAFISDILTNPNNPTFLAAKKNDLLDWSPKSQTMLCSGSGDPTVPQAMHQTVMKAAFDAKGLTNVTSVDVHPLIVQTFGPITLANIANYHGTYAPPFCHAAAKTLFDAVK
ncbi:lipase family protein [Limnohabitans sp.]|uniref:lipase family protein n=1 Tax=Limnohabitans sp. TaxID=1907725 RepID=UPI0037BEBF4B